MNRTLCSLPAAIRWVLLISAIVSHAVEPAMTTQPRPSSPAAIPPLKKYNPDGTPARLNAMISDGIFEVAADGVYNVHCGRSEEEQKTRKKLASIIIPKVEIQKKTLPEAIKILMEKSKEADPEKVGVAIELTGYVPVAGTNAEISMSLSNVPLSEAIKYVATLADFKYAITHTAVTLAPISTELVCSATKQWEVRPDFINRLHKQFAPNAPVPTTARAALEAAGVPFPEGTVAIYSKSDSTLTVRTSPESPALIEAALLAANALSDSENSALSVYNEHDAVIYQRPTNGGLVSKPVQLRAGKRYRFRILGCSEPNLWFERVP